MEYKKELYKSEALFEQNQYLSTINKCINTFEYGLRELIQKYIDSTINLNDKRKILSVINEIGRAYKTLDQFEFSELLEVEKKLNLFFNLHKKKNYKHLRMLIFDLDELDKHKTTIFYNKSLIQRIDAELFLTVLKTFLLDFDLIEPLFTRNIMCGSCGNNIPENSLECPFCGISLKEENVNDTDKKNTINEESLSTPFIGRIKEKILKLEKNSYEFWEAVFFNNSEMIYIPEGNFKMGSEDIKAFPKEKPIHKVFLSPYWISKYEITFKQYDSFCEETGYKKPFDENWGRDKRPVINVSWFDALAYCDWLSTKTGLVFRLPTEAEWERASKGNNDRIYPWGNSEPTNSNANFNYNFEKTTEVDKFKKGASPFGLYDMSGNVREWCLDWYDEKFYGVSPQMNPKGPNIGNSKVIRGGGWGYDSSFLRTTDRNRWVPDDYSNEIGFRIVLESK